MKRHELYRGKHICEHVNAGTCFQVSRLFRPDFSCLHHLDFHHHFFLASGTVLSNLLAWSMSSSSDTAISLPAELVDLILNYFDENHPQDHLALGFCSLVSCSWLPRCRHKLFNAVKIGSKTRAQQLDQLLRDPQSTLSRQISRVSLVIDREYCDDTNLADSLLGQLSTGQDINTISLKIRGVRYYVELDLFSICFRHLDNIKSLSLDLATCISPAHMYQLGKLRKIESLSVKSSFYLNAGTLDEVDDCLYPPPSLKTVWLNKPLASKALLDWLVLSPTSLRKIHMEYEGSNSKELLAVYPLLKACCKKLKHLILCSRQPLRRKCARISGKAFVNSESYHGSF